MVTSSFFFGFTFAFGTALNFIVLNIINKFNVHGLLTTLTLMPGLITPCTKFHFTHTLTIVGKLFDLNIFFTIRSYTKFDQWVNQ
jgi:hypothetical protein